MMDDVIYKISRLITADPDVFYEDKLRIDLSSNISGGAASHRVYVVSIIGRAMKMRLNYLLAIV